MTAILKTLVLDEAAFFKQFAPRPNHLDKTASVDFGEGGCLFSAAGKELRHVLAQPPRTLWTLIEGDDGRLRIESGLHLVNRLGYLVTRKARASEAPVIVFWDDT